MHKTYAIVEMSGRQFFIEEKKCYNFNRIPGKSMERITLKRVLLLKSIKKQLLIGKPYLKDVRIEARILKHLRDKKTIVYKMRPKKKTRKKQGHRQELTRVFIKNIIN